MALDKYRADIAKICEDKGMPFGELDEQAILDSYGIFLTPEQVVDKFAEEFDDDVYEEGLKGEFAIFVDTGKPNTEDIKDETYKDWIIQYLPQDDTNEPWLVASEKEGIGFGAKTRQQAKEIVDCYIKNGTYFKGDLGVCMKIDEIKIEWNKLLNEAIKAKDDRINSQRLNDLYFQALELELGVDLLPDV